MRCQARFFYIVCLLTDRNRNYPTVPFLISRESVSVSKLAQMQFTQIKETCLYFRDLRTAYKFYHEKLGLPVISYVEGKHVFFRVGSSVLLVFNPLDSEKKESPPPHSSEGNYHFAFEVLQENYAAAKEEIRGKGIEIIDQVNWKSGQESFYFRDPEMNVLEIVPRGIWE